ncbi:MAG: putative Ig domain-containing protein [Leptospiraceae bacterium]|nr:putative Ig domain-containing protein [Leptospiraceae bacterium]
MEKLLKITLFVLLSFFGFFTCNPSLEKSNVPLINLLKVRSSSNSISLNYTNSPYVFTLNESIAKISPEVSGTITSCTSEPSLPEGLTLGQEDCSLTGTPVALQDFTEHKITAQNSTSTKEVTIGITVNNSSPASLSYASSPFVFSLNVAITTQTPTYSGTITSCTSSPSLPSGLSLSASNCALSGTPTVVTATTTYTITASNSQGSTQASISITVNEVAPSSLSYGSASYTFTKGVAITSQSPTVSGSPTSYSVTPTLPTGLSLDTTSGVLSGTPSVLSTATNYTITASNSQGSTNFVMQITVNDLAPSSLSYASASYTYTKGVAITSQSPTVTGTPTSYSVSPSLPSGLSLNTTSGVLSGTPSVLSTATNYTITASNTGGSTNFAMQITVNDVAPSSLSYTGTPYSFYINSAITSVTPTVTGTPTSYSVSPSLPSGLAINTTSGVLSGTPTATSSTATYTVTATNSGGSTTTTISITVSTGAPYFALTGTPDPATVFNTIDQTYHFYNNLSAVIWHSPSNTIYTGHYSVYGYIKFTGGTGGYSQSTNNDNCCAQYGTMVLIPRTKKVIRDNNGWYSSTAAELRMTEIDGSGVFGTFSSMTFSDSFSGSCNLISSSAEEFLCYDGTGVRHYSTTSGSNTLTFVKIVSFATQPSAISTGDIYGGTFAWDGMYYYFAVHGNSNSSLSYQVYKTDGSLLNTFTPSGSGALNSVYFDWSVGRYSSHDGYGNRTGGSVFTWSGGTNSDDSRNFGPVSSYHTAQP